jgi:hypothetical protein
MLQGGHRVAFDFEIAFSNGGGLKGWDFRLPAIIVRLTGMSGHAITRLALAPAPSRMEAGRPY